MAIDPATLKAAAAAAKKAVGLLGSDEQGNPKLLMSIVSMVSVLVVIFALIIYILSTPIGLLTSFLGFTTEYANVIHYGYVETEQIGMFPLPCQTSKVKSGYGEREHPLTGITHFHTGIDFATEWHSKIVSIAEGTVEATGIHPDYGRYVLIRHDEFYSFYAHLSTYYVSRGQPVEQQQVIGLEGGQPLGDDFSGDTLAGSSTGHHLHFEIRLKADASSHVDPSDYILIPPAAEVNASSIGKSNLNLIF